MDSKDSHEEGIRWMTLAATSSQHHQAKQVCLQRAIHYLQDASQSSMDTPRYAKSLRNLAMAHWLLAQAKSQCKNAGYNPIIEMGRIYTLALKYYACFFAESTRPAMHDEEYAQCLGEALKLCELMQPKEAVATIESYLGVIPDKQGSYRYKCLVKMSDILEHHAKDSLVSGQWEQTTTEHVHSSYLESNSGLVGTTQAAKQEIVADTAEV